MLGAGALWDGIVSYGGKRLEPGEAVEALVPGIWVAGNATDASAQVITAAAAGLKVGAQINADLVAEDTAHAVAAFRAQG